MVLNIWAMPKGLLPELQVRPREKRSLGEDKKNPSAVFFQRFAKGTDFSRLARASRSVVTG